MPSIGAQSRIILAALAILFSITSCNKPAPSPSARANPSTATPTPQGYTLALSTPSGQSLLTQKTNIATVPAALLAVFPDLAAYFGNRPTIGSAYQDAHDSTVGGATFNATYNTQPIRGIVSCKLHDNLASISVIFDRTDAPKSDWEKLMGAPPQPTPAAGAAAATPEIPLTEYTYPDGTGSVGLAAGWSTQSQSAIDPTIIKGPADQIVILHNSTNISTPNSLEVKQRQRLEELTAQNAARFAHSGYQMPPPKPLPPLMIASFTDPLTALQNLLPQFSNRSQFNNGPAIALDHVISSQDLPYGLPNSKCALINYVFTRTQNNQSQNFRAQILLVTAPLQGIDSAWMLLAKYSVQAPEAAFDQDLPIMLAMVHSEKVDQNRAFQVASARNQQMYQMGQQMFAANAAAQKARFEQFQRDQQTRFDIHEQQQAQVQAGYDAHNQQFKDDQLQRSRNAADFNESIIGTRTIYDTVTGQSGYANLTDVNGVVDSLNQAALDPNRFVQIPLRDQLYPIK